MRALVLLTGSVAIVAGLAITAAHDPAPAAPTPAPVLTWTDADADVCRVLGGTMHGVDACRYEPATVERGVDACAGTLTYEAALAVGCFNADLSGNAVGNVG